MIEVANDRNLLYDIPLDSWYAVEEENDENARSHTKCAEESGTSADCQLFSTLISYVPAAAPYSCCSSNRATQVSAGRRTILVLLCS